MHLKMFVNIFVLFRLFKYRVTVTSSGCEVLTLGQFKFQLAAHVSAANGVTKIPVHVLDIKMNTINLCQAKNCSM